MSVDSFPHYGTDNPYLNYLARLVRPGGAIGIAGAGMIQEFAGHVPDHLQGCWEPGLCCLHSAPWWRHHWERSGIVSVELADALPDGWRFWLAWQRTVSPDNHAEIQAVEADGGRWLGYVRTLGRRRPEVKLEEPIISVPSTCARQPYCESRDNSLCAPPTRARWSVTNQVRRFERRRCGATSRFLGCAYRAKGLRGRHTVELLEIHFATTH